jgi:hypothetical protein
MCLPRIYTLIHNRNTGNPLPLALIASQAFILSILDFVKKLKLKKEGKISNIDTKNYNISNKNYSSILNTLSGLVNMVLNASKQISDHPFLLGKNSWWCP